MKNVLWSCLLLLCLSTLTAQETIEIVIKNNSFELDGRSKVVKPFPTSWDGPWTNRTLNTPSVMSSWHPYFKVSTLPKEGNHFVAIVSREDYNNEGISQMLDSPLLPGTEYLIRILACSSKSFVSNGYSLEIDQEVKNFEGSLNYNYPVRIVLIGRNKDEESVLGKTGEIQKGTWREYDIEFIVTEEFDELVITVEALNLTPAIRRNGNVLIDRISHIYAYW